MTKIIKEKGLVLKTKAYRETSKIVTIFTEKSGKLTLLAKGIRKSGSKTAAIIDPLNLIEFVYYFKANRELQYLSNAEFIRNYSHIKSDYNKIKVAFNILELTNLFTHEAQVDQKFYELVVGTLDMLDKTEIDSELILIQFLIRVAEIAGYPIYSENCPLCGKKINIEENTFNFSKEYGLICGNCSISSNFIFELNEVKKELISRIFSNLSNLSSMIIERKEELHNLIKTIIEFLEYHVEELKKLKSFELE